MYAQGAVNVWNLTRLAEWSAAGSTDHLVPFLGMRMEETSFVLTAGLIREGAFVVAPLGRALMPGAFAVRAATEAAVEVTGRVGADA